MSIAAHPGFERALADSAGTASQAIWLTEWMRLGETVLATDARSVTAVGRVPDTSSQEQLKCQTPPDRSEALAMGAAGETMALSFPSRSSAPCESSHRETA